MPLVNADIAAPVPTLPKSIPSPSSFIPVSLRICSWAAIVPAATGASIASAGIAPLAAPYIA